MQPSQLIYECRQQTAGFFDINISDVITFAITIVSGIIVTFYVQIIFGKKQKRLGIIDEVLCNISDEVLRRIMTLFVNATNRALTQPEKHEFAILFRIASNDLSMIHSISKEGRKPVISDSQFIAWTTALFDFKASITDKP